MLVIETLIVGAMQTNCYLLYDTNDLSCFIIDPGDDPEYISSKVLELNLKPQAILATHGHFDHITASLSLKLAFEIPFFMSAKDKFLLERMKQTAEHFLKTYTDPPASITEELTDSTKLNLGKYHLKVIETPGHTPGSVALYIKNKNILFVGDLVFADYRVGRTDSSYGRKKDLWESISKLSQMPPETVCYPGHGDIMLISDVRKLINH